MEQNIHEDLYNNYRKLDSGTERLKTALQSSILNFNLGGGVNFSVAEDPKNKQNFVVTFTLSYNDKSYVIGSMSVNNFDASDTKKVVTFSNNFIKQMVNEKKCFEDPTIVIDEDSAREQALHFLQKHRKISSQLIASYPGKDVIDEFLKALLRPQEADLALNNCLARYPKRSTWPFYVLSGSALVFLAMCITGSVFMNILGGHGIDLFVLADFGAVIGGVGLLACLISIVLMARVAFYDNSTKNSVIQVLTQINQEKSDLSPEAKKVLESSVDQEASLDNEKHRQDGFHASPVPSSNPSKGNSILGPQGDATNSTPQLKIIGQ